MIVSGGTNVQDGNRKAILRSGRGSTPAANFANSPISALIRPLSNDVDDEENDNDSQEDAREKHKNYETRSRKLEKTE